MEFYVSDRLKAMRFFVSRHLTVKCSHQLLGCRCRMVPKQRVHGHDKAGRAEAALRAVGRCQLLLKTTPPSVRCVVFTTRCRRSLQSGVWSSPRAVNTVFSHVWRSPRAVNTAFSQVGSEWCSPHAINTFFSQLRSEWCSPRAVNTVFSQVGCEWCSPHTVNTAFSQLGCEWCVPLHAP